MMPRSGSASAAGVNTQTIRHYERSGLFVPARTPRRPGVRSRRTAAQPVQPGRGGPRLLADRNPGAARLARARAPLLRRGDATSRGEERRD